MASTQALERLREIGPIIRFKEAVAAGVSWRDLYDLRDAGEVLELSRGLFQLADAARIGNVDFVAVCTRAPHGMIAVDSALSYWDLFHDIPAKSTSLSPTREIYTHVTPPMRSDVAERVLRGSFAVRLESSREDRL